MNFKKKIYSGIKSRNLRLNYKNIKTKKRENEVINELRNLLNLMDIQELIGDKMELEDIISAIEINYPDVYSFSKREMLKELRRIQELPEMWRKEARFGATINMNYDCLHQCANELENRHNKP
jgi:hypothetical protein